MSQINKNYNNLILNHLKFDPIQELKQKNSPFQII
jgi:hypothetical protein